MNNSSIQITKTADEFISEDITGRLNRVAERVRDSSGISPVVLPISCLLSPVFCAVSEFSAPNSFLFFLCNFAFCLLIFDMRMLRNISSGPTWLSDK